MFFMKLRNFLFLILTIFISAWVPGCATNRDGQSSGAPTVSGYISTGVAKHN
jgi:hypothetical protein